MAEEVKYVPVETGANIDKLLDFQTQLKGVKLEGYPGALGPALVQLGYMPPIVKKNIPGYLDDLIENMQSERFILLRKNVAGFQVPSRWYEWLEDRKDIFTGIIADYGGLLAYPLIGFFAGLSDLSETEEYIKKLHEKYPIDPRWEIETALARYGYEGSPIPGFESTKKPEEPKKFEVSVYKRIKNEETGEYEMEETGKIESDYPISNIGLCGDGVALGKPFNIKDIIHYVGD